MQLLLGSPTFRAENSNTTRHLSEFWMIEPEIAFADLTDNMQLAEDLLKYAFRYVLENAEAEMDFFDKFIMPGVKARLETLVNASFGRVTYTEAIELLKKSGQKFDYQPEWGIDLQTEHERYLSEKVFNGPVFVTKNGYGTMVLMSVEQYSVLTEDIEHKLDEADETAEKSDVRYSSSQVFGRVRSRINEHEKV